MLPSRRASCWTAPRRNEPRHTRPRERHTPPSSRPDASSDGWNAPDLWMTADDGARERSDSSPMGDAASADLAPPQRYVVHKPSGDPDAARRLASAYDTCADALVAQVCVVADVLDRLGPAWRGTGARASQAPERVLAEDCQRVAHAL